MMFDLRVVQTQQVAYEGAPFNIMTPRGDHIGKAHATGHFYEEPLLTKLKELLDQHESLLPGPVFDVGAHVGNHSLFFAGVCKRDVFAFEPQGMMPSRTLALLHANVNLNSTAGVVEVIPYAIGFGRKRPVAGPEGNSGMARCESDPLGPLVTIALDGFAWYAPSLVKIDVEGSEVEVLDSMSGLIDELGEPLSEHASHHIPRPILVIEAVETKDFIFDRMARLGYRHAGTYCATPTHVFEPRELYDE